MKKDSKKTNHIRVSALLTSALMLIAATGCSSKSVPSGTEITATPVYAAASHDCEEPAPKYTSYEEVLVSDTAATTTTGETEKAIATAPATVTEAVFTTADAKVQEAMLRAAEPKVDPEAKAKAGEVLATKTEAKAEAVETTTVETTTTSNSTTTTEAITTSFEEGMVREEEFDLDIGEPIKFYEPINLEPGDVAPVGPLGFTATNFATVTRSETPSEWRINGEDWTICVCYSKKYSTYKYGDDRINNPYELLCYGEDKDGNMVYALGWGEIPGTIGKNLLGAASFRSAIEDGATEKFDDVVWRVPNDVRIDYFGVAAEGFTRIEASDGSWSFYVLDYERYEAIKYRYSDMGLSLIYYPRNEMEFSAKRWVLATENTPGVFGMCGDVVAMGERMTLGLSTTEPYESGVIPFEGWSATADRFGTAFDVRPNPDDYNSAIVVDITGLDEGVGNYTVHSAVTKAMDENCFAHFVLSDNRWEITAKVENTDFVMVELRDKATGEYSAWTNKLSTPAQSAVVVFETEGESDTAIFDARLVALAEALLQNYELFRL